MTIVTRLTEALNIKHPIISAPMAFAAGGKLAAAVCNAGALGLIGGGYGDIDWIDGEFKAAGNAPVGCGFITWSLAKQPKLLDRVLRHAPRAIFCRSVIRRRSFLKSRMRARSSFARCRRARMLRTR